jgi:rhodanese-related sulfurtransferase
MGGFLFANKTKEGGPQLPGDNDDKLNQRSHKNAHGQVARASIVVLTALRASVYRWFADQRPSSNNEEAGAMAHENKIADAYQVSPATGYAGDVAPVTAWKILNEYKNAVLIDVRTRAEWNYVGLPDLDTLGKKPALIEWQDFPGMQPNPQFVSALSGALRDKDAPLLFICRSGARSAAAAKAMTAAGYSRCLNVADGFEGPLDAQARRGTAGGWKAAGLPWRQT